MNITSAAFQHNEYIPSKYTCDGENVNPPLTFSEIPQNAKSIVLIMDDPDAPAGTWVHWIVYNIDPSVKEVDEHVVPTGGVEGITSFGRAGYGGPCPPPATPRGESGTHRYFFKLYALNSRIEIKPAANKEGVEKAMEGHILDNTELIGLYQRP